MALKPELSAARKSIQNLQSDTKKLKELAGSIESYNKEAAQIAGNLESDFDDMSDALAKLESSLAKLESALKGAKGVSEVGTIHIGGFTSSEQILEKLETADGLVVGSPVYYASPNGSLISLLDRLFLAGAQSLMALKPGAAVTSARRAGTTSTLEVIQKYFTISQMPVVSSNYWPMVHGSSPQEVAQDKEGLQIMRILGRNMAWMLSCIQSGEKAGVKKPQAEEKIKTSFIR